MSRLRPLPIALFAGVTLLIWGNRVWLAWTDATMGLASKLGYSVPITGFVLAAAATLAMMVKRAQTTAGFRLLVSVFAGGTVAYWAIRLPMIVLHHHPVAFKVVHAALAAVSVAFAARAWQARPRGLAVLA